MNIRVTKRNGRVVSFDAEKINETIEWACEGLDSVSSSSIALQAQYHLYDGIKTNEIQNAVINAARDLTTVEKPNYNIVAGRLLMFDIRKQVYGQFEPLPFYDHIYENIVLCKYDKDILVKYSKDEIDFLETQVEHERDLLLAHPAVVYWQKKYLIRDRVTEAVFESPQYALMLIAMCLHEDEPQDKRLERVGKYYNAVSTQKISLPSPIMSGVRSPTRQFSSCVLVDASDDLDSINAAGNAIVKYASKRAGIGINGGRIRALGSPVRGGEISHTGCINFYKKWQGDLHSCSQGGMRTSAATLYYPFWHLEIESLLVLKNNKGTESNRVRHMDYTLQVNRLFYKRFKEGKNITLFSPSDVGDLYELFFTDQDKFERMYEELEKNTFIRKKTIKASELMNLFAGERAGTGRIYIMNVDHVNNNGAFDKNKAPVYMSNLCVAPETQILTDTGYTPIAELEDQETMVWNGEKFTSTVVRKTGVNQKLLKVSTSSGHTLECTPYHKWYVIEGYGKKPIEKRTHELNVGDKLIKFDLPVIDGERSMVDPYQNGFFSADGCTVGSKHRVYFYGEKRSLVDNFELSSLVIQEEQNRIYGNIVPNYDKFYVPVDNYTIESRLKWLAGWLDGDGCVYRNGSNQQLVGTSIESEFLKDIQRMLQTLGVNSKITLQQEEGYRKLPKNDGSGELDDFWCKHSERLLITSCDVHRLMTLGLGNHLKRLEVVLRLPQRDARHFSTITSVEDLGRVDDTYCFTESERGMGMFNGILTGQCAEIVLPTSPLSNINDGDETDAEIALCTLAAFNLGNISKLDELEELAMIAVRALDNLLDYQDYPVSAAKKTLKRRTLGVGVINYSYYLAKNHVKLSDGTANNLTHRTFEAIQYYLIKASVELAKERGKCEWFDDTVYAQGNLPIDRFKKEVDQLHTEELHLNWEALRSDVLEHGMRNSTLSALMPAETSAIISNATNGIEPQRGAIAIKASKDGNIKIIVPEYDNLKDWYEFVWDLPNNTGYLSNVAIMQKFIDQTISANTNYDPAKYPDGKVPLKEIIRDIFFGYKYGMKTFYYHNTRDRRGVAVEDNNDTPVPTQEEEQSGGCESGACHI